MTRTNLVYLVMGFALLVTSIALVVVSNADFFDVWGLRQRVSTWPWLGRQALWFVSSFVALMIFGLAGRVWAKGRFGLYWLRHDWKQPICLFRSFRDDMSTLPDRRGSVHHWVGALTKTSNTLERTLAMALARHGSLVAIGRPGERLPPSGFSRFYPQDWHAAARTMIDESQLVVLVLDTTPGVHTEIGLVIEAQGLSKLLVCLPDIGSDAARKRWTQLSERLAQQTPPITLPGFDPLARFLWFPAWTDGPRVEAIAPRLPPARAYRKCLLRLTRPFAFGQPVVVVFDFPEEEGNAADREVLSQAFLAIVSGVRAHAPVVLIRYAGPWPRNSEGAEAAFTSKRLDRRTIDSARRIVVLSSDARRLLEENPRLLEKGALGKLVVLRPPVPRDGFDAGLIDLLWRRFSMDADDLSGDWLLVIFPSPATLAVRPARRQPPVGNTVCVTEYARALRYLVEWWTPTSPVLETLWPEDSAVQLKFSKVFGRRGMERERLACLRVAARLEDDEALSVLVFEALLRLDRGREALSEYHVEDFLEVPDLVLLLRVQAWGSVLAYDRALTELRETGSQAGIAPLKVRMLEGVHLLLLGKDEEGVQALKEVEQQAPGIPMVGLFLALGRLRSAEDISGREADLREQCSAAPELLDCRSTARAVLQTVGLDRALALLPSPPAGSPDQLKCTRARLRREAQALFEAGCDAPA